MKNYWKHLFGMIMIVILVGLFLHYHMLSGQKPIVFYLSMFAIANVLGVFAGYWIEVIQRTFKIGTASKKDMYATIVGANIGYIILIFLG